MAGEPILNVIWARRIHTHIYINILAIYQYVRARIYLLSLGCLSEIDIACMLYSVRVPLSLPEPEHGQTGFWPFVLAGLLLQSGRDFMFAYILSALLFVQFRATSPGPARPGMVRATGRVIEYPLLSVRQSCQE